MRRNSLRSLLGPSSVYSSIHSSLRRSWVVLSERQREIVESGRGERGCYQVWVEVNLFSNTLTRTTHWRVVWARFPSMSLDHCGQERRNLDYFSPLGFFALRRDYAAEAFLSTVRTILGGLVTGLHLRERDLKTTGNDLAEMKYVNKSGINLTD